MIYGTCEGGDGVAAVRALDSVTDCGSYAVEATGAAGGGYGGVVHEVLAVCTAGDARCPGSACCGVDPWSEGGEGVISFFEGPGFEVLGGGDLDFDVFKVEDGSRAEGVPGPIYFDDGGVWELVWGRQRE